jgi:hypothetical protein
VQFTPLVTVLPRKTPQQGCEAQFYGVKRRSIPAIAACLGGQPEHGANTATEIARNASDANPFFSE